MAKKRKHPAALESLLPTKEFPDEALAHPTGSTLASQPECLFCESLFWAGDLLVALSTKKLAHFSCFLEHGSPALVASCMRRMVV